VRENGKLTAGGEKNAERGRKQIPDKGKRGDAGGGDQVAYCKRDIGGSRTNEEGLRKNRKECEEGLRLKRSSTNP